MEYEYLTQEDFAKAKENGISYENAYARFYNYGWNVEDSITKPLYKPNLWNQYKELANKHGIKRATFYTRVYNGSTPEEAATVARMPHRGYKEAIKITSEIIQQAAANGITKNTLCARVYQHKWSVEKAMTTPVDKTKRRKDLETVSI